MFNEEFVKELQSEEVVALKEAYYRKFEKNLPYYVNVFRSIEDYKHYMQAMLDDDPETAEQYTKTPEEQKSREW